MPVVKHFVSSRIIVVVAVQLSSSVKFENVSLEAVAIATLGWQEVAGYTCFLFSLLRFLRKNGIESCGIVFFSLSKKKNRRWDRQYLTAAIEWRKSSTSSTIGVIRRNTNIHLNVL